MKDEKDQAHDQRDVNDTGGHMKREKPKQPENDQDHGDKPKHGFISLSSNERFNNLARLHGWRGAPDPL
jgi:hypothetical protein